MATKLYLHNATNTLSGTLPSGEQSAQTPTWTAVGGTTLRKMDSTIGTAQASSVGDTIVSTALQRGLLGMWVSLPLSGAQTVGGGTMTLNVADKESNDLVNFWANSLNIYVWRPSTGALVGTVRDAASASLGGTEGTTGETVTHITGITTSAVSASDGDVVVCELWSVFTQGAAASYTVNLYYDGTTENTTENATVSNHASFIELAEALSFQVVVTPVATSDTLTPSLTEASALLSPLGVTDTLTPAVVDASQVVAVLLVVDTLTPSVADVSALLSVVSRVDALTPAVVDVSQLAAVLAASDVLTPSLAEARGILSLLTRTDTLTPELIDAGVVTVPFSVFDTLTPALIDTKLLLKLLLDPRTTVLLRSRFFANVHIGVPDEKVVVVGNAPITVTKRG